MPFAGRFTIINFALILAPLLSKQTTIIFAIVKWKNAVHDYIYHRNDKRSKVQQLDRVGKKAAIYGPCLILEHSTLARCY